MIVLALDTALSAASAAVLRDGTVLAVRQEPMERGHAERAASLARETMDEAGIGFPALTRIGVTVGPGSFTGLRVGLALAKGLALALGIPCFGVGTLTALAAGAGPRGRVAALIDARRGQVYLQTFEDGRALGPAEVLPVEAAQARLNALAPLVLIGPGAALLDPPSGARAIKAASPDPVVLARLAGAAAEPIGRPEPLYLRAPEARTIAERASG